MTIEQVQTMIREECRAVEMMLLAKNLDYGNSALAPLRIFSRAATVEQINVRIDDKLSRLANRGEKMISEDTEIDLIGYLILKRVAVKLSKE